MSYTSTMARKRRTPRCIAIVGPNGAGKTTFARDYLRAIAALIHFVNVDLIAGGISPLRPELAAVTAVAWCCANSICFAERAKQGSFARNLQGRIYGVPQDKCDPRIIPVVSRFAG